MDGPQRIVQHQLALLDGNIGSQGRRPLFLFFFSEEGRCRQLGTEHLFLIVRPADQRIDPVVAGIRFQVEVVTKSFQVVVGCPQLQVDIILRVVASQVTGFEQGVSQFEFREESLDAEFIIQVIVVSGDACLVDHRHRQFECFGYLFRILYCQQQREIVFFYFFFLLRRIDQCRDISFESVHKTRYDRGKGVCTGNLSVQDIGRDSQMAVQ